MKKCCLCNEEKTISSFHKNRSSRDGHTNVCKPCAIQKAITWGKRNPEKRKLACSKYIKNNPDKRSNSIQKYLKNNPENRSATSKNYYLKNKTKIRLWASKYVKEHRGIHDALTALYRARKFKATPKWANQFFIEEIYDLANRRNELKTGGVKWHVDHIIPLKSNLVCGLHVENNLRVIPSIENLTKSNRHWPDMPNDHVK